MVIKTEAVVTITDDSDSEENVEDNSSEHCGMLYLCKIRSVSGK